MCLNVSITIRGCFLEIVAPLNEGPDDLRGSLKNFAQKIFITSELPERTSSYKIAEVRLQINGIVQKMFSPSRGFPRLGWFILLKQSVTNMDVFRIQISGFKPEYS